MTAFYLLCSAALVTVLYVNIHFFMSLETANGTRMGLQKQCFAWAAMANGNIAT